MLIKINSVSVEIDADADAEQLGAHIATAYWNTITDKEDREWHQIQENRENEDILDFAHWAAQDLDREDIEDEIVVAFSAKLAQLVA